MGPSDGMSDQKRRTRGDWAIDAIFMIVVLLIALLAAAMVSVFLAGCEHTLAPAAKQVNDQRVSDLAGRIAAEQAATRGNQ